MKKEERKWKDFENEDDDNDSDDAKLIINAGGDLPTISQSKQGGLSPADSTPTPTKSSTTNTTNNTNLRGETKKNWERNWRDFESENVDVNGGMVVNDEYDDGGDLEIGGCGYKGGIFGGSKKIGPDINNVRIGDAASAASTPTTSINKNKYKKDGNESNHHHHHNYNHNHNHSKRRKRRQRKKENENENKDENEKINDEIINKNERRGNGNAPKSKSKNYYKIMEDDVDDDNLSSPFFILFISGSFWFDPSISQSSSPTSPNSKSPPSLYSSSTSIFPFISSSLLSKSLHFLSFFPLFLSLSLWCWLCWWSRVCLVLVLCLL